VVAGPSPASESALPASPGTRAGPVRTCVGCRQRAVTAELLRVVVAREATGPALRGLSVVPDPRRRTPGRGAWLHPDPACVELAQRRRAFGRALRVPEPVDLAPVREYLTALGAAAGRQNPQE
jgi:predicted RNA-binding protein YlxR (DUF448 family)